MYVSSMVALCCFFPDGWNTAWKGRLEKGRLFLWWLAVVPLDGWKEKKKRIRNCFNYFKKTIYYTKRLHLLLKIQTSNYLILNGLKVFQVFLPPGLNYFKYSEKWCIQHFYIKHEKENIYIFSDNLFMYTEESKHYDFFLIFQWAHLDDV